MRQASWEVRSDAVCAGQDNGTDLFGVLTILAMVGWVPTPRTSR